MAGVVSIGAMRELGHDTMWIAMLGLMLWRWPDYAQHMHHHVAGAPHGRLEVSGSG